MNISNDLFKKLFENLTDPGLIIDTNNKIILQNAEFIRIFGDLSDEKLFPIRNGTLRNFITKEIIGPKIFDDGHLSQKDDSNTQFEYIDKDGRLHYFFLMKYKTTDPFSLKDVFFLIFQKSNHSVYFCSQYTQNCINYEKYFNALELTGIIAYTDSKGIIKNVNDNFCTISGFTKDEIIGNTHSILKSGFHERNFYKGIWDTISAGKIWRGEIKNKRKDGSYYWVDSTIIPVLDKNGTPMEYISIRYDISSRIEAENKRRITEANLQALYDSSSRAIILLDLNKKIISFNNKTEQLFSTSMKKKPEVGMPITEFLHDDFVLFEFDEYFNHTIRTGEPIQYERHLSSDKSYWFEIYFQPVRTKDGDLFGVGMNFLDITVKKNFQDELLKTRENAEKSALAKSEFLSRMSHEIRTPLNAIIGLTDILMFENHNTRVLENLKTIKLASDNLLIIVNDILNFSKIEEGKIVFENTSFSLRKLIDKLMKIVDYRLKEKGLEAKVIIDERIPDIITGDAVRLNQIILNLLSNAIKFTFSGSIDIIIMIVEDSENSLLLKFAISDTGIGIPENKLDKIFDSFTQADSDTTRKFGESGLGLTITKKLIELQGGVIIVSSMVNHGSTFSFQLRFGKNLSSDIHDNYNDPEINLENLPDIKLLLVEDNEINQIVMNELLSSWNIYLDISSNGIEALELLEKKQYNLIFMDLQMPGMDGFELTSIIRNPNSSVLNHDIPIIALTADAFPETKQKVLNSGMNGYITKPFKQNQLYNYIQMYAINPLTKKNQ